MNEKDVAEQAYKNGYEQALKDLKGDRYRTSWKAKFFEAKKEIERLTEEKWQVQDDLDNYHEMNRELEKRNAELQKQVDELTERYLEESKERCEFEQKYKKIQHAHNIGLGAQRSHWEKKVQQAVKDTAKEIYILAEDYNCGNATDIEDFMLALKERYGVEVK
jgi:DNA repair exonuclease SbcCD ATPase subunit